MFDRDQIEELVYIHLRIQTPSGHRPNTVLLYGPPGTGKTTLAFNVAKRAGLPLFKMAASQSAMPSEILGGYAPDQNGQWKFTPGVALHAWGYAGAKGGILLIDDVHNLGQDAQSALYTACDAGQGGSFTLPSGILVKPDDYYSVILTSNTTPDDLDQPVKDRLQQRYLVGLPSTDMLNAIDARLRPACAACYAGTGTRYATYREWATISNTWASMDRYAQMIGAPSGTGFLYAVQAALGDETRTKKLLAAIAPQVRDAAQALQTLVSA